MASAQLAEFLRSRKLSVPPELSTARRLLIIDDEPTFLRAAKRVLESTQLTVETAVDPLDGMLRVGLTRPDAVLVDVCMPRLDGVELCRRLRSHSETEDIQLLAISAAPSESLQAALREVGVSTCLPKPLDARALLEVLGIRPTQPEELPAFALS